jgi:hypothetical protein
VRGFRSKFASLNPKLRMVGITLVVKSCKLSISQIEGRGASAEYFGPPLIYIHIHTYIHSRMKMSWMASERKWSWPYFRHCFSREIEENYIIPQSS